MMRIDLRYLIAFAAFYVPGLMMLTGAWMLGYTTLQVRGYVSSVGAFAGMFSAGIVALALFEGGRPIWFRIGRSGKEE